MNYFYNFNINTIHCMKKKTKNKKQNLSIKLNYFYNFNINTIHCMKKKTKNKKQNLSIKLKENQNYLLVCKYDFFNRLPNLP